MQPFASELDYEAIKTARVKLKANAAVITSTFGGGNHDILGLRMSDEKYLLVSSHAFITPPNPGLLPTVQANLKTTNTYKLVRQHKYSLKTYHEVKKTDRSLK